MMIRILSFFILCMLINPVWVLAAPYSSRDIFHIESKAHKTNKVRKNMISDALDLAEHMQKVSQHMEKETKKQMVKNVPQKASVMESPLDKDELLSPEDRQKFYRENMVFPPPDNSDSRLIR